VRVVDLDRLSPRLEPPPAEEERLRAAPQVALVGEPRQVLREVCLELLEAADAAAHLVERGAPAGLEP